MKGRTVFGVAWLWLSVLCVCGLLPVYGTETEIWTLDTSGEFEQGELEQLSLTADGELMLAPRSENVLKLKDQNIIVWALVEDSQGNVYAGTGEQGQVLKIAPDGDTSLFFDSPEVGILSLAVDAVDNVYAGSAPDGLIYKLTPDGSQTVWFATEEHYVWSLVFDESGVLYAGTGEHGKIFKILPDGSSSLLYDSPQSHVMALVHDIGGWLYAGTEGKGITYKIGLDGNVFSLYDAKEQEIRALTLDSLGNLYIAAISSEFLPQTQTQGQVEPPEVQPTDKSVNRSTIYRITPVGTVTTVVELPEVLIYAMITDQDDHLLVGTDTKGRLYRVLPAARNVHQVLSLDAGNISGLLRNSAGHIYAGTSDAGSVVRIDQLPAEEGSYLSPVHDAAGTATWGKIFWRGATNQIALLTRTGNTAVPDDTWSSWSQELLNKEGAPIPNPAARFIQWKAVLKSAPDIQEIPLLDEVSVAFLPHNLAPEIHDIAIFSTITDETTPGNGNGSPATVGGNGGKSENEVTPPKQIPPGYLAIGWEAQDPNQDSLEYTVQLRGEHETRWKMVEEELENGGYFLDTETLSDGGYYVKITASDIPDNPPDRALTGEKVSKRFEIDNTSPEVLIALNQRQDTASADLLITVLAQDGASRLIQAEYALDGEEWISIFPDDAVTDSRDEKYSIPLTDLTEDQEHLLVFRVTDSHQNIGVAKFVFSPQETEAQPPTP